MIDINKETCRYATLLLVNSCSVLLTTFGYYTFPKDPHRMEAQQIETLLGTQNPQVQCSAVQCSAVQCSAVQCSAVRCIVEAQVVSRLVSTQQSEATPHRRGAIYLTRG